MTTLRYVATTSTFGSMEVRFKRTGARRYAVEVVTPGKARQVMSPAPGYDDDIPHDLVHYVVEAELRLSSGVFGRAAKGGGTFVPAATGAPSTRELARQRRKQQKRESAFRAHDAASAREMESSERLAALCDVMWRRQHGQRPDASRKAPELASEQERARVAQVVTRLDAIAPMWRALPVGSALVFSWPQVVPIVSSDEAAPVRSAGVDP